MVGSDGHQYGARHGGPSAGGQQQVQKQTDGRQRVGGGGGGGLMPTDGQDAYKRTSMRASKRSRADRLSYLVATGHINKEEAQELCLPLEGTDSIRNETSHYNNHNISHNNTAAYSQFNSNQLLLSANNNNNIMTTPMMITTDPTQIGDQTLLDYVSSASITPDNFKTNSQKIKKNLKVRMPTDNRGQFRRSRTEVTLPMKTSPAFEYILKDKGRRNRRCYLWLIYSVLMTIGLTVVVFCGVQLVMRYQSQHHL